MKLLLIAAKILFFLSLIQASAAAQEIIFSGRPQEKISEGGNDRVAERINKALSEQYKCVITKQENKYFWATRENVELIPITSGAFTTFLASNGSGYIRIINKNMKEAAALMSDTEDSFDYVENLIIGLRHISYYGKKTRDTQL